ncbi:MAG TPA: hypothetical protein DCS93_39145 [Microscillaceae bacterium]|nr:hypothetical protein [Microscillaceae bacterium]
MKNHITVVIAFMLGLHISAQAQKVGQIKKKAKSNSERRSSERRSSSSSSRGSSGAGSDFAGAVCSSVLDGCVTGIFNGVGSGGSSSRSSDRKTKRSREPKPKKEDHHYFQLKASYGFLPNNYQVFRPGARVRFGKKRGFGMAFDYRYNYLSEKILEERISYITHDIQFIQFAPEVSNDVEIRAGFGFMRDEFNEFYPEFLAGFNALSDQTRWNFGTEIRVASDFSNGTAARVEWGSHVQYALVNNPKFKVYGGLRTKVASYFGVGLWSIGLGLTMRVY